MPPASPGDPEDGQATAEAVREQMYGQDRAAQALGITVEAIGPGSAVCRMAVREDMLNGHATCHGGLIFTLADTAFAYACNAGNRATVALACQISFIAPARAGRRPDRPRRANRVAPAAPASMMSRCAGPTAAIVALFRGQAYEIRGTIV